MALSGDVFAANRLKRLKPLADE